MILIIEFPHPFLVDFGYAIIIVKQSTTFTQSIFFSLQLICILTFVADIF